MLLNIQNRKKNKIANIARTQNTFNLITSFGISFIKPPRATLQDEYYYSSLKQLMAAQSKIPTTRNAESIISITSFSHIIPN